MTRMKHLLRKLHIGAGGDPRPVIASDPSPTSASSSSAMETSEAGAIVRRSDRAEEFSFLEEEFQVQLALAISASDPSGSTDPESLQIKEAKRISLGCSAVTSVASSEDGESGVEFLSLRYWNYNFVNYDEKVTDGFYDVYGIISSLSTEGKMPSLAELQVMSVMDKVDYEVIIVNRSVDIELQQLEQKTFLVSMECQAASNDPISNGLIQKIADLVVDRMGGPVSDADEMLKRWTSRRYELWNSLNSIVLPLGCLDVGLSRHRALLFKVLADSINLPCMLVKGSYYTGTDEGAVNLIKINNGSEYIVDLMGAPGTLIPSEANTGIPFPGVDTRVFPSRIERQVDTSLVSIDTIAAGIPTDSDIPKLSNCELAQAFIFEHDFGRLPPLPKSCQGSSGSGGRASSSAQKMKVNDVSDCVISAAKNPRFAQRLHAVLLENGSSPPIDLMSDMDKNQEFQKDHLGGFLSNPEQSLTRSASVQSVGLKSLNNVEFDAEQGHCIDVYRKFEENAKSSDMLVHTDGVIGGMPIGSKNDSLGLNMESSNEQPERSHLRHHSASPKELPAMQDGFINNFGNIRVEQHSERLGIPQDCQPLVSASHRETISSMLRGAEWEIQWEDLHIGDRIGIGSYGEVFHADLNGTEVAVKRFLDQDLTGDALMQFKSEVEMMLRLRHPNVVLFMGAVTRPPNLSILTEYLPRGSLYKLLHNPSYHLDERRRIRMALDVAKGMNCLHTSHPTIVHRDLKSPNLLVDKNWVVKVCDFGLSRLKHQTFLSSKSTAGTPEWMAPEVLKNEPSNEKSDVFSYGVILWELLTLRVPWSELNAMQVVGAVGFQNRRLDIPTDTDPSVAQLISDCWQNEQQLRPSFAEIMQRLKRVTHLRTQKTGYSSRT
uniref:non-specific serine/threonine protein kinase n=1 Tax=Kalanchoe fedtschenkoi TaxID=63787 RepID=A0A7N0TLR2_KALFE